MSRSKASLCIMLVTCCTLVVMLVLPITPKVPVQTVVVERGTLLRTLMAEGVVEHDGTSPCYAPVDGLVADVLVSQGQRVTAGELVARLDSSLEERQMAEYAVLLDANGGEAQADRLLAQGERAVRLERAKLLGQVEIKQIRAAADGVVERLYARPGMPVTAGTPLLAFRGESSRITAVLRAQDAMKANYGTPAAVYVDGELVATARVSAFDAPRADATTGAYVQTVAFTPVNGADLSGLAGRSVSLEVAWDCQQSAALAPISAVDREGRLWTVRDQKAYALTVDADVRNERYVRVPDELAGARVVLSPDGLSEGCRIKEVRP